MVKAAADKIYIIVEPTNPRIESRLDPRVEHQPLLEADLLARVRPMGLVGLEQTSAVVARGVGRGSQRQQAEGLHHLLAAPTTGAATGRRL